MDDFMKLSLRNDTVVYYGPKNEDSAWGFVQFPKFYDAENGLLGLYIHDQDDAPNVLGEGVWMITPGRSNASSFPATIAATTTTSPRQ